MNKAIASLLRRTQALRDQALCPFYGALLRMRNRHLAVWDLLVQPLVVVLAFALRLDAFFPARYAEAILLYGLLAILVKLPVFYTLDMYNRLWRYAGYAELRQIVLSGLAGSALLALVVFFGLMPLGFLVAVPRSIPLLDAMLTVVFLAIPRLLLRASARYLSAAAKQQARGPRQRVLIAGAGDAGLRVLTELEHNTALGLLPVGVVDDDPGKHGLKVQGCRVLGPCADIPRLVHELSIQRVIIAMPSADGKAIRALLELCRQAHVEVFTLPGLFELLSGEVNVERTRRVQIEDLLRRPPVSIDRAGIAAILQGERVLVTGAGGSIGSELCRQIAACRPASLVLLGHGENSIYLIGNELHRRFPNLPLISVVADVRDRDRLEEVFREHRPRAVFHAAAHKHVPLMEDNVADAITNNVLGTRNLVEVAAKAGVTHFVMISTDKAVNPTSVMGATKRLAELLVQDVARRTGRCFVAVRFGNVLGSRGSVVPLFQQQIALGGPVTVTDPEMRRYFMTIPEAVQLVLQAATLGHCGEVFFLDMGEPVKIVDLARDLIALSGLEVDRDIDIVFTGLRPGEKLFEELALDGEDYRRSRHEKIFICRNGWPEDPQERAFFFSRLDALLRDACTASPERLRASLRQLVPTYQPAPVAVAPIESPVGAPAAIAAAIAAVSGAAVVQPPS
ncbi:MAG: polysaccharide biosynthesis protein [Anaerolineae bacterium]